MLSHAVHQKGWKFLPRYVIQPMVANWAVGFALFTTYTAALPAAYMRSSVMQTVYPDSPKKPTTIVPPFAAGALAGLAQSIVATPLDALRIRFEVEDMLNGRYQSWFGFVKDKVTEDGIARLYRGFRITAVKDVLGFSAFFGIFEFTKIELLEVYRNLMKEGRKIRELAKKQGTSEDGIVKSIITGADSDSDKFTRSEIAQLRRMAIYQRYNDLVPDLDVDEVASNPQQAQPSPRAPIKAPLYVLPSLLLPPYLGQASCILIAGGTAALAYQAIDYPLEQLRNYVYTELAKNEIKTVENKILHALRKHYRTIKKEILSSKTRPDVEWHPYHHFWNGLKQHAAKELNRSPESFWTPIRYLYSGWFGVAIRSVPATSIGLLFYEIVKQWLEDEYM
ncbi:hypothetical protein H4219_005720 [Mycoemilia scoparia]|uniref:Mitochondrial carrier n=1 Tax=Mycoemilia scoparia TaxID=417184 RepID=A0A9W7ZMZ1_9FUNG|nr:hypothetical protein H4219_005720 [Mycoemilia scoparia]